MFLFQVLHQTFNLGQQTDSIFRNLATYLKSYYPMDGKSIRQLQDFFSWFNLHRPQLLLQFKRDLLQGNINGTIDNVYTLKAAIGFWLGVRYALHIGHNLEGSSNNERVPKINVIPFHRFHGAFEFNSKSLNFMVPSTSIPEALNELQSLSTPSLIIIGLNLGLHEGVHALAYMLKKTDCILSELATSSVMLKHGLPIKEKDLNLEITGSVTGLRNFPFNINEYRAGKLTANLPDFFMEEYLAYVLSPWVSNAFGKKMNVLNLTEGDTSSEAEMSMQSLVFSVYAILDAHSGREAEVIVLREMGITAERIYKDMHINDTDLLARLTDTFKWIGLYALENRSFTEIVSNDSSDYDSLRLMLYRDETKKFLKALVELLDSTFGKPSDPRIPKGYARLDSTSSHTKQA